jgi:MFS transporter, ACDE family, multidrug resistance protein
MAERWGLHVPFYVGAVGVVIAIAVLSTGHGMRRPAEQKQSALLAGPGHEQDAAEAEALNEELGSAT